MAAPPTKAQSISNFAIVYSAATIASIAPILITRSNQPKLRLILQKILSSSKRNVRLALLPTLLPVVYRMTERFVARRRPGGLEKHPLRSQLPALLASPLFLLLPAGLRIQVALYFLSTFIYAYAHLKPRRKLNLPGEQGLLPRSKEELVNNWRDFLPPVWTISVLADTWLLWAFLHEHYAFPAGYSKIIVDHSRRYLPANRNLEDILRILRTTDHRRSLITSPHDYITCEVLHPTQVSCSTNFAQAFAEETQGAVPWVAGFTAFSMLISGSLRQKGLLATLYEFLNSTARGTVYIAGSITTAWGITCALQRVLPIGALPKGRWLINGSLSNVWILLLSRSRQIAISLYQARLAMHSMWKVYKARGGRSIRHGEILVIALCWIGLLRIKYRTEGNRIKGVVGQAMRLVDGTESEDRLQRKRDGVTVEED